MLWFIINALEEHLFSNVQNLLLNYICILKSIIVNAIEWNLSDHNLIYCSVDFGFRISDVVQKWYSVSDYGKLKVRVREQLESFIYSHDVSVDTNNFLQSISNVIDSSTVWKCLISKTPWINCNLYKLIAYKKKFLKVRKLYE